MSALRVRRLVLLLGAAGLVALSVAAGPVTAAEPTVTAARATVEFLEKIRFEAEAEFTADVARAEFVLEVEGSERAFVATIGAIPVGRDTLVYELETPGGRFMPGTTLRARFRLTKADGSTVEGRETIVSYEDTRIEWNTLVGEFVTVHWTEGGQAFGQRAVDIADTAVRDVGDLLGVQESEPIDFYIYADRDAFYDVLGPASRENVGGQAHADIRTLFANIGPGAIDDPWVGVVIPHEMTHLVFDTAVDNNYHFPPHWLNEGIAVYLSEGYGFADRSATETAASNGTLMPLRALTGDFPTTGERFNLAYSLSVSAVDFMVREHGQPAMVELVRSYADGVTDDEAFEAALGVDVAGFEAAWLASLGADDPVPYGPVDPPPGPVPSDWRDGEVPVGSPGAATPPASQPPGSPTDPEKDGGTGWLVAVFGGGLAIAILGLALWRRNRAADLARTAAGAVPPPPPPAPPDAPPIDRAVAAGPVSPTDPAAPADPVLPPGADESPPPR